MLFVLRKFNKIWNFLSSLITIEVTSLQNALFQNTARLIEEKRYFMLQKFNYGVEIEKISLTLDITRKPWKYRKYRKLCLKYRKNDRGYEICTQSRGIGLKELNT